VRAVLDPNVIISGLLSPDGAPARILIAWRRGLFELVVSAQLTPELQRALSYSKIRDRIDPGDSAILVVWLTRHASVCSDPVDAPSRSTDPGDDYLVALAASTRAILVSGDRHLLALADTCPIVSPVRFLDLIQPPVEAPPLP